MIGHLVPILLDPCDLATVDRDQQARMFDFGVATHEGVRVSFVAMEWVDGKDLRQITRTGNNYQPDWSK